MKIWSDTCGEVKRFKIRHFDEVAGLHFESELVVLASDHERVVAELKAQLEHSETKVTWLLRDNERVSKGKDAKIAELEELVQAYRERDDSRARRIAFLEEESEKNGSHM